MNPSSQRRESESLYADCTTPSAGSASTLDATALTEPVEPRLVSVVAGCFNEEGNVRELYERVKAQFDGRLRRYRFELILIDNASTDGTVSEVKALAASDPRVKLIVNTRNFGHVRSSYHAILQANGDAVVAMASDLQDPPELLPDFISRWEKGFRIVLGQKVDTQESWVFARIRTVYYDLSRRWSDVELVEHATGFGLYDRCVIEDIRRIADPYPYFRGLVCELGYERALVPFRQPLRRRGITKNNFYTLWDLAMLGLTSHSKVPLRLATFGGLAVALCSLLAALGYLMYKLLFWDSFQVGTAPMVIGMFFIGAVQLVFVGVLGEYIGAIHTQVLRRPPVIEKERVNFD